MTREQIITEINSEIAKEFEISIDDITPDAPIYETLMLDSLSLVDLIGIVHVKYGVLIQKSELPSIKTFGDLYDYIESHLSKA